MCTEQLTKEEQLMINKFRANKKLTETEKPVVVEKPAVEWPITINMYMTSERWPIAI